MNFCKLAGYLALFTAITFSSCNKGPTCNDGKQNGGERGIDCSGPCEVRCDCFDGIANFGEEGVDCGGLCKPCSSCEDGEQNGDETGIDCGGDNCPPCEVDCEAFANMFTYTVGNSLGYSEISSGKANAFLNDNDELIIIADNSNNMGSLQISQAKPGFANGAYSITNRSITFIYLKHIDSRFYSSEIEGSEGIFQITEFVNETDCKYFSATFQVVLTNSDKVTKVTVSGLLEDIDFLPQQ